MAIKAQQLRELITDTLEYFLGPQFAKPNAVELLMLTAAAESECGTFIEQWRTGPALGIYQIEPATYDDLFENFLSYREDLQDKVDAVCLNQNVNWQNWKLHLKGNLLYQTVIARLQYWRFPEGLPHHRELSLLARYYKKYWNTYRGKASVEEAINKYHKYCKY